MKQKFAEIAYKSPQCVSLDLQEQLVLCSSSESESIDDFSRVDDDWN